MSARDMERQALNVYRMRLLGAQVHGVETGTAVLKDAVSETFREGTRRIADTHYVIGSCIPAHIPPRARRRPHSAQLHVFCNQTVDGDATSSHNVPPGFYDRRDVFVKIVSWMTTNRCNLKCEHCYQDASCATAGELSTDEARTMIDGIARAGFDIMIFSGGEPLMRPDIFDLVAYAAGKGLRPVFGSNGTLIDLPTAKRLKEAGACAMGISLDSTNPEEHDRFRGVEGAYDQTIAGIEACKQAGLPFQLHTTVMEWNRDQICDLTDFAAQVGAKAHYIFFLVPVGRGLNVEPEGLSVLENEELLREVMRKSKDVPVVVKPTCAPQFTRVAEQIGVPTRFTRGCLAGLTYCVVGSEGIVRPCAYMTESAGDVRQQAFDDIWENSPIFKLLRTRDYSGTCGSCDYQEKCGGCRARAAYYHNGDLLAQDDYCAYAQKLPQALVCC
jgi:putative heme d1 biosynthesis radical SAM protein NirJ2